jgi:hypothetical protein
MSTDIVLRKGTYAFSAKVLLRLTPSQLRRIEEHATRMQRATPKGQRRYTRSDAMRELIEAGLKQLPKE